MKIEWLGHSSFKLTESTGTSIITDPFNEKIGIPFPNNISADIVTISHNHYDHDAADKISGEKTVIDATGAFEIGGVQVHGFMSYHDKQKGALRGKNIIYKIRMDGVEICHLGDIGEELTPMLAELIGVVNILLIPVGGKYTINAREAKEYVDRLMPDVVIPMHYMQEGYKPDLAELDEFLELFDKSEIEFAAETALDFDRTDFDGERTKVIICKRD
ncbi:MAG: MBL fold metallo-hydrolase [Clostridia bacterium]